MEEPKGRGLSVRNDRAVNAANEAMRSSSISEPPARRDLRLEWGTAEEVIPILENSMAMSVYARRKHVGQSALSLPFRGP